MRVRKRWSFAVAGAMAAILIALLCYSSFPLRWSGHDIYYTAIQIVDVVGQNPMPRISLSVVDNKECLEIVTHSDCRGYVYLMYKTHTWGTASLFIWREKRQESKPFLIAASEEGYSSESLPLAGKRVKVPIDSQIWHRLRSEDVIVLDATAAQLVGWVEPDEMLPDVFGGMTLRVIPLRLDN